MSVDTMPPTPIRLTTPIAKPDPFRVRGGEWQRRDHRGWPTDSRGRTLDRRCRPVSTRREFGMVCARRMSARVHRSRQLSRVGLRRGRMAAGLIIVALALWSAPAFAEGVAPTPIPQNPSDLAAVPEFVGSATTPHLVRAPTVPQNQFMAPNGRSNLHYEAYITTTYVWLVSR